MSTPTFTPKQLADRWNCDPRSVRRRRKAYGMQPSAFTGIEPVYTLEEVERAERAHLEHMKQYLELRRELSSRPRGKRKAAAKKAPRIVSMAELIRARKGAQQ